ncbi:alpha/beta hydrolase family protein [Nocardia arthritidis]|uniref:Alpha/beta fold hydrolase n=1 Tax=Nocardia arthritidis TaxID=228602 RepID=A0A6G9YNU2_9NOCA|nr:alpha/beta fold hydrolase [Nocardia arthritidis]QIS14747.1 alpha/beta fold hydrolase [Nocardia arthritidis]
MRAGRLIALALFVIAAMVVGTACSKSEPGKSPSVLGDWHGSIRLPDKPLQVGVSFLDAGKATIDIPAQGVKDLALKDVQTQPDRVRFAIPDVPGDPKFDGKLDGDKITGTFHQGTQEFPLELEHGKLAPPARPQEPKPPFPYKSDDVTYRSGDLTIAGTLTEPNGSGPFPAVLLVVGSGPNTRDEEIFGHKPFLLLADTFTRAGYAVLRTDQRGVGGTGGKLDDANYNDLADDILAGVRFLKSRPEIDGARVGLMGHSQGGYTAPLAAARPDSGVAFVISMAGPSVLGGDVLVEQTKLIGAAEGTPADQIDTEVRYNTELTRLLRAGDIEGAKAYTKKMNGELHHGRIPDDKAADQITPYLAALVSYDPAPALEALRVPVLAFYGGKDLQVSAAQNEQPMRDHLRADPDATVHTFPGLNHLMQPTQTGKPSEYVDIETTIAPEVLTYVTDWLKQRFPTK